MSDDQDPTKMRWGNLSRREQQITITGTFIAGYARMKDLERTVIFLPGNDAELARLKRWWNNIGHERREAVEMWVKELPQDCERFASMLQSGGH